ncbi:MAG TPA: alpha/beta hydrolase [Saprospiraceae bacterium]
MNKLYLILLSLLFTGINAFASIATDPTFIETPIVLETKTGKIFGTLTTPKKFNSIPVALIIAGSGPTDRDCNNPMVKSDAYKKLAHELAAKNIATVRYDKRGIGESQEAGIEEADLRFDHYVNDAKDWITILKHDDRFTEVIIIGHSEGSLIGMLASGQADKFISIAGPGQSADKTLREQLSKQPQQVQDMCFPILDSLTMGKTVNDVNPMLNAIFRPSVQPYLISWFKYDPQVEIQKLKIPVQILQGTNDLQVTIEDAQLLSEANPKAKLVFFDNMNHVLTKIDGDAAANAASYNNPALPLAIGLVDVISDFVFGK